ncbi:MAG: tetratricopeptide repeat protein [Candidatus Brocadiia bacterium]
MRRVAMCMLLAAAAGWTGSAREELVALRAKLAADNQLDRSRGLAAQLQFAQAHKKDPQFAAQVIYQAGLAPHRRDGRAGDEAFEKLLDQFPEAQPWADLAAFYLARVRSQRSATRPKALELYEAVVDSEHIGPGRRADARFALGMLYREAEKPDEAIAAFRAFLAEYPDQVLRCAQALAGMGACHVARKEPQEAYEVYHKLTAEYPWAQATGRELLVQITQAFRVAEQPEAAIEAYQTLLQQMAQSDPRRAQVYSGLATVYLQQEDREKAVAIYRRMATDPSLGGPYRASAFRQLFRLSEKAEDHQALVDLGYRFTASYPSRVLESDDILDGLVVALVHQGRIDEAIAMGRAHYRLTRMAATHTHQAILAVVRALKAKEGGLRTANAFIEFVQHGSEGPDGKPGTDDDLADPTADIRLPPEPRRDKLFAEAERRLATEPDRLGYLYIIWDKPAKALAAFRRYYLETVEPERLQRAVTLLTRAMRAVDRPESEIDAFFEFQNYGPNGKDGKPGTGDDLADPLAAKK